MSQLHFDHFEKALLTLDIGLNRHALAPDDELLRDGVIQRFEYYMDLAWKLIQRYLKSELQIDESYIRSQKDLFREAAKMAFIADAEKWISHYNARNETSHSYNPITAREVFEQATRFFPDAMALLKFFKNAPTA
jgi:nucleotidyltransferase substrate binding protein (TIGR01987 family)